MAGTDDIVARALLVLAGLALAAIGAVGLRQLLRTPAHRRTLCVGLLLLALLLDTAMVEPQPLNLGIQVFASDVVAVLMMAAVLVAFTFQRLAIRGLPTVLWLGLGLVMMLSFAQGVPLYGKTAGVDVRPNFYFWAAAMYCAVVPFDEADIRRIVRWCVLSAYALAAIAVYRWLGFRAGFVSLSDIAAVGASNEFRALPSGPAFCIAAVALVQFMAWMRGTGSRFSGLHALVFTVLVLVLQHRSVWLAAAAGYALVLVQQSAHLPRRLPLLMAFCIVAAAAGAFAAYFGLLDRLAASLWESVVSVFDPKSTATDRMGGWEALIDDWLGSSPATVAFGYPYGTSFRRVVDRVVVEYSPHNFYVYWLLRVGVVGTVLFVAATLIGLWHALRAPAASEYEHLLLRGVGVVLFASVVYYVPYQGIAVHGAVTGLALALFTRRRAPTPARKAGVPRGGVPPLSSTARPAGAHPQAPRASGAYPQAPRPHATRLRPHGFNPPVS